MSQTFFTKLDSLEKNNRLSTMAAARGEVTLWIKGTKDKKNFSARDYDKERGALILDNRDDLWPLNSQLLCTFELRGMNFFAPVIYQKSVGGFSVLLFAGDFFKSERRSSYRLMTYPLHTVWTEIDLGVAYQGSNVIGMKTKSTQTNIFKNFLNLVNDNKDADSRTSVVRIRVQDLSTTGMALHIGELEKEHFPKDRVFQKVKIQFTDEVIEIPEIKVMYVAPYIGPDKNLRQFKLGIHFERVPLGIDQALGKKINELLRDNDKNKDFENFIK